MKFETILEYTDQIAVLTERNLKMIDDAKVEVRSLDEAQLAEFDATKEEIVALQKESRIRKTIK